EKVSWKGTLSRDKGGGDGNAGGEENRGRVSGRHGEEETKPASDDISKRQCYVDEQPPCRPVGEIDLEYGPERAHPCSSPPQAGGQILPQRCVVQCVLCCRAKKLLLRAPIRSRENSRRKRVRRRA